MKLEFERIKGYSDKTWAITLIPSIIISKSYNAFHIIFDFLHLTYRISMYK